MKTWKKILCLCLALTVALAIVGCGAFAPRMVVGMQKMSKLESLHSDTTVIADVTLSMLGMEVPVTLEIDCAGDHQKEPSSNLFDVKLSLPGLGIDQSLMFYTSSDAEQKAVYTSWDGGKSWVGQSVKNDAAEAAEEAEATPAINAGDLLKAAMGLSSYFTEAEGTADADSVVFTGVLPAELVQELLSGLDLSALEEALPEGMQLDLTALAGEIPASLVLDKASSMITRVEMDLTSCATNAAETFLSAVLEQYGLDGSSVAMTVNSFHIVTELSQFDAVSITPPALPEI